ncbi:MAG: M48 family metallopeptidase [Candidatus Kryptoniota bacterium]
MKRIFSYPALPVSPTESTSPDDYLKTKITFSLSSLFLTLAYLTLLTFTNLKDLFIQIASINQNIYVQFLLFVLTIEIFFSVIKFPLDYYLDFVIERRFKLSNQTFTKWLFRKSKSALVASILGVILLLVFYFLLVHFPKMWWLMFAAFFFLFQIFVAQLFPTLILPMFYKLNPLSNDELHDRLNKLVEKFGYKMNGVFSFDLSRETRKANAALTGLGKSRKIIISDTLLENFSNDEIEVVLAHELGHLVKHHMMKGIILSAVMSLIGFYIMAHIHLSYSAMMRIPVYDLAAIPFLAFVMTIFVIVAMPLGNFYSRTIEREADIFALETTGMRNEFAESMRKLGRLNLSPENPPAWIEKIFFSHPSIGARIKTATEDR